MDKITIMVDPFNGTEIVQIDKGNGEFTSMPKEIYDKMQAEQGVKE